MLDGKYGFIDSTGRVVVPPKYDSVGEFSEGLALVVQNGKAGYVNRAGKAVVAPQFERAKDFSESLAPVRVCGKWGYVGRKGQLAIEPKYAGAECFECGMGIVDIGNRTFGIIDRTGRLILQPGYYYIYVRGHCAIACSWDSSGRQVRLFNPSEGKLSEYALDRPPFDYSGGPLLIHNGTESRFVDSCGKTAIGPAYDGAYQFYGGRAAVGIGCREDSKTENRFTGGKWGFIDRSGKMVIEPKYDQARYFNFDSGVAQVVLNGRINFIDTMGRTVFAMDSTVTQVGHLKGGRATARVGGTPDSAGRVKGGKWGFIDRTGRLVVEARYDQVRNFSDGYAAVTLGGNYGYIDTTGKIAVEPKLKDACDFSGRLAHVETEQGTAYIDRKGKVVWQAGRKE